MVVSMGGLVAVAAAIDSAPSKQEALRTLVARKAGSEALSKARVRRDLAERQDKYVLPSGAWMDRTKGDGDLSHVHVVKAMDDPKAVLVQQTERAHKRAPGVRREGILFLHNPSEARVKEAASALARTLRLPRKKGNG
jgi:hypothetical protein